MKNTHVLPTDKPSRLGYLTKKGKEVFNDLRLFDRLMPNILDSENQHLYITSDEEITGFENNIWVIKGDRILLWQNMMALGSYNKPKKIILTTDQDLIKDGVQAIDDEFLEWFVKNPSCEEVEVQKWFDGVDFLEYKIIIPKEKPKQEIPILNGSYGCTIQIKTQETLEEAAEKLYQEGLQNDLGLSFQDGVKFAAEWQQDKNKYSEEDVLDILREFYKISSKKDFPLTNTIPLWFEQFKKK